MTKHSYGGCCTLSAALLATVFVQPAAAQDAAAVPAEAPVTYERLLNVDSEPQNWLTHNRNYAGDRHSALDQITRENVGDLEFAFAVALQNMELKPSGTDGEVESTPLVDNGMMYLTDGWGRVYKIDVSSGERGTILWKMDPAVAADYPWGSLHHRGVALLGDAAYSVALDGRLISTNRETGEVNWEQPFQTQAGEYFTVAPLALNNKIMWGAAGGETGTRDWLAANDPATGNELWRTYTIPAPGEPNAETWADDHNAWQTGGGSIWVTGVFDPETNTTIWGVGNPSPDYDPEYRPGDNLYTNSALALDPDTGEIKWWFQYTPNDAWDFDEVGSHILIDLEVNGEMRKTVGHVARNGFYYTLDRGTGAFVNGGQYLEQVNWTAGLDPKTGMPVEYDPNLEVQVYAPEHHISRASPAISMCPTISGGTNWWPTSYSKRTGLIYGTAIEGCGEITNTNMVEEPQEPGGRWSGGNANQAGTVVGSVYAVSPADGALAMKRMTPFTSIAGVLTTAGGLVFSGQIDGEFEAMNDETLDVVWRQNLGTMMEAPPITYMVGDTQYVAVLAGGRPSRRSYFEGGDQPELGANIEMSYNLWVFKLDQD